MLNETDTMYPVRGNLLRTSSRDPIITTAEAKDWLRVDYDLEDSIIYRAVLAVQDLLEPPNGWLGRALSEADYTLYLPRFADKIIIPAPPLINIESVEYLRTDGTTVTVDAADYRVVLREPAYLLPAHGKSWPSGVDIDKPDAVQIKFKAGYPNANNVPDGIKQFILYQVSQIHDLRNPSVVGTTVAEVPHIRHSLESWRIRV